MDSRSAIIDSQGLAAALFERRAEGNPRVPAKSLRDVAAEIGLSATTLSRVERASMPDLPTYVILCRWLGVPLEQFIRTP